MLFLKLMTGKDMADSDPNHDFKLVTIGDRDQLEFVRREEGTPPGVEDNAYGGVIAWVTRAEGSTEVYDLMGNAYVLNAQGKTIASHASY